MGVKNNMRMQTYEAIYLRRNYDRQNGYIVMELRTGSEVIQNHVNPIPLTDRVKKRVEQLATIENMEELGFTMRESEPPTGTLRDRNVGVGSDEVVTDETTGAVG